MQEEHEKDKRIEGEERVVVCEERQRGEEKKKYPQWMDETMHNGQATLGSSLGVGVGRGLIEYLLQTYFR